MARMNSFVFPFFLHRRFFYRSNCQRFVAIFLLFSCRFCDHLQVKMETGLPGATQVLVIRPVEEVHVRDKERAPTHPPREMAKTAKEVVQKASLATHNHVSTT